MSTQNDWREMYRAQEIVRREEVRRADATIAAKDAELAGYREANAHLVGELNDALEDARKYSAAQVEIVRLREALTVIADPRNIGKASRLDVAKLAGAALATVEGVGNG